MTIRYGIRWDGRGRPKPARMAALGLAALVLLLPASARADEGTTSMDRVAGGSGIVAGAPLGAGVDVALIDSGVVPVGGLAEPGRVIHGPDFSSERRNRRLATLDTFGHGTHLAGLIAGRDPVTGFAGVAPGARVVSLKVAGSDGETSLAQVLSALEWVHRNRNANGLNIRVVNLALGVEDRGGYKDDVLAWAVEQLWRDGIVVVAAAGNNGAYANRLDIPAADPFVIAAGASDTRDTVIRPTIAWPTSRAAPATARPTWWPRARRWCPCACRAPRSTASTPAPASAAPTSAAAAPRRPPPW